MHQRVYKKNSRKKLVRHYIVSSLKRSKYPVTTETIQQKREIISIKRLKRTFKTKQNEHKNPSTNKQ